METLQLINCIISILFVLCYTYQFFYIPVPWLKKDRPHAAPAPNRFAVLICARNEAAVIGDLIASIRSQSYDASHISIFVLAVGIAQACLRLYDEPVRERLRRRFLAK